MKIRTVHFTTLLVMTFMLLAGCSGCAQKNLQHPEQAQQPDDTTQNKTPIQTDDQKVNGVKPKPPGKTAKLSAEQFKDFKYLATLKGIEYIEISRENIGGIPLPWDPLVVPLERWKKYVETLDELRIAARQKTITDEEYEAKLLQNLREYGLVANAQLNIEVRGSIGRRGKNVINLAYAENPDDFDTLLLWVLGGGNEGDRTYGTEKTAGARRLYEMDPDHPWVLHYLAKCLLGSNPKEALVYAQRAQARDSRYLRLGLEGACYYQLGDYDKALTSLRRSYRYAMDTSQPGYFIDALGSWISTVKSVVDSGGKGEDRRQKLRKAGRAILGPSLPILRR